MAGKAGIPRVRVRAADNLLDLGFNGGMKDYYRILEVHPEASGEVIHKAYRTLAQKYHPDRYHTSHKSRMTSRMQDLNEAYAILGDPARRSRYDRGYSRIQHDEVLQTKNQKRMQTLKRVFYWALLGIFLVVMLRTGGRVLFFTPFGKLFLLLLAGYLFYRVFRKYAKRAL